MSSSFYLCWALVPADGILLIIYLKLQHLFINWAAVPAGQALKASTAASPNVIGHSSTELNFVALFFFVALNLTDIFSFEIKLKKLNLLKNENWILGLNYVDIRW